MFKDTFNPIKNKFESNYTIVLTTIRLSTLTNEIIINNYNNIYRNILNKRKQKLKLFSSNILKNAPNVSSIDQEKLWFYFNSINESLLKNNRKKNYISKNDTL